MFVADVSLCFSCNHGDKGIIKYSPNPNVLLELGYAVNIVGWDRIICICNTDYGSDYPFDIAPNRRTSYSLEGKDKKSVRRKVGKIILSNIQNLKGQISRGKQGFATHVVGSYDFEQKSVISALIPITIEDNEKYRIHNQELLEDARRLYDEIQVINKRMEIQKLTISGSIGQQTDEGKASMYGALSALDNFGKSSDSAVKWDDAIEDKSLIKQLLAIEVDDAFFDLGDLRRKTSILGETMYRGTEDEKAKYNKLKKFIEKLSILAVRMMYSNTFKDMRYIPLAIQNVSKTKDANIRIVIYVEKGQIIEPTKNLVCEELEGTQGFLCSDDNKMGIIPELFMLCEDGNITREEVTRLHRIYPIMPDIPVVGYSGPAKSIEDYEEELQDYIASAGGRKYYEFEIRRLRPQECRWMSGGMLIKPMNGKIIINYSIQSNCSAGDLEGRLEYDELTSGKEA